MSAEDDPLASLSDERLVDEHSQHRLDSHYLTEMLRRHKQSSERLGDTLRSLNRWLLLFTVAIFVLTGALVWMTLRDERVGGPWVLWVRTQGVHQETTTNVLSAFDTKGNCRNAEREAIAALRAKYPGARVEVADETVWLFREGKQGDPVETFFTFDYYCLPDTVDPRGPKGK